MALRPRARALDDRGRSRRARRAISCARTCTGRAGRAGHVDKADADTEAEQPDPGAPARGLPRLGLRRRGDRARAGRAGRADLARRPERRDARLPAGTARQRGVDRRSLVEGRAPARRRVRLRLPGRRRGPVRLGRGLRAGARNGRPASRALPDARSGRSTSCSSRAPATATPQATWPASPPRASAPCRASPTAWPWWPRARPRPPSRSTGPRPGTTRPGTPSCAARGRRSLDEQGREVAYAPDGAEPLRLRLRRPRTAVAATLAVPALAPLGMARDAPPEARLPGAARAGAGGRGRRDGSRARRAACSGRWRATASAALVEFAERPRASPARTPDGPRRLADGGALAASWPGSRPTTRRWRSPSRARSSSGATSTARRRSSAYRDWLRSRRSTSAARSRAALQGRPEPRQPGQRLADAREPARRLRPRAHRRGWRRSSRGGTAASPTRTRSAATRRRRSWSRRPTRSATGTGPRPPTRAAARLGARGERRPPGARRARRGAHRAARSATTGTEGWVKIALQNAFHELLHAPQPRGGRRGHGASGRRHRHERGDRGGAARRRPRPRRRCRRSGAR